MKIRDENIKVDTISMYALPEGHSFIHRDILYIKTTMWSSTSKRVCVSLSTGRTVFFAGDTRVRTVDAEVVLL